jgi:abhydrolase domain-containing protein 14
MTWEDAEYDGKKIFYLKSESSSRKTIALFHGYSFESGVWEKVGVVSSLNKIGYNVYAFDMPGFPKSRNKPLDLHTFFSYFESFAKSFGKVSILGASAGGYLAAKFSEENPKLVENLILVGGVELEKIKIPSSIRIAGIWGSEDSISNPSVAKKIIESLGGKFFEIKGARHACYLDKPDEFNLILTKFLEEN